MKNFLLLATLATITLLPNLANAEAGTEKNVYVDFAAGKDTNQGFTPEQPLQHAPGDPNATDHAKSVSLSPGDTVRFKGGITYRGSVVVPASGAEKSPITFDGNTDNKFGAGPAIIDGSEPLTIWKPCASPQECGNNPHWKNIYRATTASAQPFATNLYQSEKICWLAQDPNPRDSFYPDRPEGHRKITTADAITITDPDYFKQPEPTAWDNAWLVVYASPNYPYFVKITGYDPATHTVTHTSKLTTPSSYAVLNSLSALDTPGEYVVRDSADKKSTDIFLWPHDAAALTQNGATIGRRGTAFDINGKNHIDIRGFTIQQFVADKNTAMGVQISKSSFITVAGNEIKAGSHSRTGGVVHGAGIDVSNSEDILLENNKILYNRRCSGIIANPAKRVIVKNNVVRKTGYCGIWYMHVTDSQILGNTVTDNEGVHANGISVYADSDNILIANNKVFRSQRPLTLQDSPNIVIVNNLLLGDGGPALGLWNGKPQQKITVLNNLILNTTDGEGIYAVNKVLKDCIFQNNIMGTFSGEAAIDAKANIMQNNIYLSPNQHLYDPSEKHATENDLFVEAEKENYEPKPNTPAKDAGVAPAYPTKTWPDFDFTKDLDEKPRTAGKAIDIGPYETQ